ncbi:MAG: TraB/GumN family protein [Spirochaetaceae bacterium]|jgi:pheromone shutdown-related protein TraB|nr:TraB/GumN family protein [Spirochaetaceae bacterium]
MSQTEKRFSAGARDITLIGTAHISKQSIDEVTAAIRTARPSRVAIELDDERYRSLKNPDSWKNLDIVQVLRKGQGFVLMANLALASFQKRLGSDVGVKPGEEMKAAITEAEALGIPTAMVDRPIQTTLRRAWAKNSLWGKCKLLASLLASAFSREEITGEQIEELKNSSEMDSMMEELAAYLPAVKAVLIDERDQFLASRIWQCGDGATLAVLGAGHLPGVLRHLEALSAGEESPDTAAIEAIPPPGLAGRLLGFLFPLAIVALIAGGFFVRGPDTSLSMLVRWLLWNGSLAALGTLAAGGNILAVLTGFAGAPIATLNPFLGVGLFTGVVQALVRKPKVEDLESLAADAGSLRGIYKNRALRVLLVFLLSSIGGVIGNFIAMPALISAVIQK